MYTEKRDQSGALLHIVREADGAHIPAVVGNRDYQAYVSSGQIAKPDPDYVEIVAQKKIARDAINAEAKRRLLARWPLEIQQSVNAGLYPLLTPFMIGDIVTIISESNAACDRLFAMTDVADVRAFDPTVDPAWSDIGVYLQREPV